MYENYSEESYNNNLCSDQVSVSKQVKDRKNFRYKKTKLFLNYNLCPYYMIFYGMVKDWAKEDLTDSFWVSNKTMRNSQFLSQYQ